MAFDLLGKQEIEKTNAQAQLLLATVERLLRDNAPKVEEILANVASLTHHLNMIAAKLDPTT